MNAKANKIIKIKFYKPDFCTVILYDQDDQCNRQKDCVYAESREAANEDFGTRPVHQFPFKVMVWAGITFNGVADIVILLQKMTSDADFYIENVLTVVKRDGNRLIGTNFTFQQDGAKPHTSKATTEAINSMGFSLIGPISGHQFNGFKSV